MATTRGTKIIRSRDGERLRLSPQKLQQIDHSGTDNAWYITDAGFRTAYRKALTDDITSGEIKIHEVLPKSRRPRSIIGFFVLAGNKIKSYEGDGRIGCSQFDPQTFLQIARTFRARNLKALAAKAGA